MESTLQDIKTQLQDIGYTVEQIAPNKIRVSTLVWGDTLTFLNDDFVLFGKGEALSYPADKSVLQVMINTLQETIDSSNYVRPEEIEFDDFTADVTYMLYDVPTRYTIHENGEVFSNVTETWSTIHDAYWLIRVSEMELFYVSVLMWSGPDHHFRFGEAAKFINEVIERQKTVELVDTSGERILIGPDDVLRYRDFWMI